MKTKAIMAVVVVLAVAGAVRADITIETVRVGNPGNAADTQVMNDGTTGYGAVDYNYNIGKYEVTAGQYCEFLNAVARVDTYSLYNTNMWSNTYGCKIERYAGSSTMGDPYQYRVAADYANRPVNYVSWGDAVRFANWLTNGQGNGSTETGAYNLNGAMTGAELMAVVVPSAAQRATWSAGATPYFLLTSEDEWYKAAYHDKNAGLAATYFDYPTSSNTAPGYVNDSGNLNTTGNPFVEGGTDPGNYATYKGSIIGIGSPYYRTVVGEWENSDSPYGTFDQGGNVWEWNESSRYGSVRRLRGGSLYNEYDSLHASYRSGYSSPSNELYAVGFRVSEVPEPTTLSLQALGGLAMLRRRR